MPSELQDVAESLTTRLNASTGPTGETWVLNGWTAESKWFYESARTARTDLEVRVVPGRLDIDDQFNTRGKTQLVKVIYVVVMQRVGKSTTEGGYGDTSTINDLVQFTEQLGRTIWELGTEMKEDGYSRLEINAEDIPFSEEQMQSGIFKSSWEVVYI